jgi:hypothetical protein
MEYVTDCLVEQISEELRTGNINLFNGLALIKATAKDYVRNAQLRLILKPVADACKTLAPILLPTVRNRSDLSSGYAAGNILNILCHLKTDISEYDFSDLTIRPAYLKGLNLHHVNFANTSFVNPVLTHTLVVFFLSHLVLMEDYCQQVIAMGKFTLASFRWTISCHLSRAHRLGAVSCLQPGWKDAC